jgi:hypothetical protein
MDDNLAVLYSFGLYVLDMLLPIVPAVILFRMFPDTKVTVSGPLQNLTLNATGAFAAYVVTVGLGFFVVQNVINQINDLNAAKVWTVSVPIELHDREGKTIPGEARITDDTVLDFRERLYYPSGDTLYITVPMDGKTWRTISVSKAGFEDTSEPLQERIDRHDPKVEVNAADRKITVLDPLILTQGSAVSYPKTQPPLAEKSLAELKASPPGP